MMDWLQPYLLRIDLTKAECDGASLLVSDLLTSRRIEHEIGYGICNQISSRPKTTLPHFWINLPNLERIDIRLRMHFGQAVEVPHGIFLPEDYPTIEYQSRGSLKPRELRSDEVSWLMSGTRMPEYQRWFEALRKELLEEWLKARVAAS
ncbi:hypothetical protein NIES2135_54440 [Leptolyngbya boryana NIES-2135]|jgi:hypothetical protein|uniref:Uncharacterized protein n=1 Tax=Leptolyngbya boryana NIES-2135 TaxID=1973484 RepID=A0A1Z4JP82_LEPBY|nr:MULTISPECIES: hypothetical protein [Leptolyngbya]BAY58571.1 hypothetical protein NIES2135_54440 [Leptolyngbya boryana NIES-2135]MBD2370753.1 hypothetical protein [Leptolyngbya sp. FACHB-161]MBD2377094.1 hypothetical protein [Leptolyngbya sp. FACHB-238]MBD2401537.1 hypothetical protein [Leptolyngbya sp. FACHB-239]MBD2408089.1 hypothetical protein [Leptolyngbya sp. FACHB-402]